MSGAEGKDQKPGSSGEAGNDGNEAELFPTTDTTLLSAPASVNPDAGTNSPALGSGAVSSGVGESQPSPHRTGRPKGSKNKYQGPLPQWRIEQLQEAGRVRGEQLKRDREHQRKAGLARAKSGDMREIGDKGRAVQAAKRQARQAETKSGADEASSSNSNSSPDPSTSKPGRGKRARTSPVSGPGTDTGPAEAGEGEAAPSLKRGKRGRPKKEPAATDRPAPPKEKKPALTKEELSERGRKGQAAALARHPDLYERAGAGGLRAQQAAKERKQLEAAEQAGQEQAKAIEAGQGHTEGQEIPTEPPAPPQPKRRRKTKWERL